MRSQPASSIARPTSPRALPTMPASTREIVGGSDSGEVSVPTLVIHGTEDPMYPYGNAVALAKEIPGAQLLALERVGHEVPPRALWGRCRARHIAAHGLCAQFYLIATEQVDCTLVVLVQMGFGPPAMCSKRPRAQPDCLRARALCADSRRVVWSLLALVALPPLAPHTLDLPLPSCS